MHPIEKALGFIERHLRKEIALVDIVEAIDISAFYHSHVFVAGTGFPVMQYGRYQRRDRKNKAISFLSKS